MKKLIIAGAGGFGREVLAWAEQADEFHRSWTIKGFIDDNPRALEGFAAGAPLIGSIADHVPAADEVFVCAMGSVAAKRRCIERLTSRGARFTTVTHRTAVIGHRVRIGVGVILCPYTVLSCDTALGDFVAINLHSSVAHDASLGDFSQVHCHVDITGYVRIGREVLIGSRATMLPSTQIGDGAIIGAGSVVVRDVPPGVTVFGNPAKVLPAARE